MWEWRCSITRAAAPKLDVSSSMPDSRQIHKLESGTRFKRIGARAVAIDIGPSLAQAMTRSHFESAGSHFFQQVRRLRMRVRPSVLVLQSSGCMQSMSKVGGGKLYEMRDSGVCMASGGVQSCSRWSMAKPFSTVPIQPSKGVSKSVSHSTMGVSLRAPFFSRALSRSRPHLQKCS